MTTIYFIRHAESDTSIHDDYSRPLTAKGQRDTALVTEFLRDKKISVVLSSPYKRAFDTVLPFAKDAGLQIETIDDLRERSIDNVWIDDFNAFSKKQWTDFSYKLSGGESLSEVQTRNITALEKILMRHKGKNIAIGTHGTALSTIINYYDNTYGYENFKKIQKIFPWVVKMEFDENSFMDNISPRNSNIGNGCLEDSCTKNGIGCIGMEKIDLFMPKQIPNHELCEVRTAPLGSMKAYKYTVIFARYKDKWLYCRHKDRDVFETAGGRIEPGETTLEAAKREFFEETGAVKFDIEPAFDYAVHFPNSYNNGQVFLAQIHELGDIPDFEMSEIGLYNTIPEKMRLPKVLPVLYRYLQGWLNLRTAKDEIWDVYDSNRKLTGRTHRRIDPLPQGDYHLAVVVWIQNSKGEFLITKRAPNKGFPNMWESPGGAAAAGDDSLTSAIKEAKEETGLDLKTENGMFLFTHKFDDAFLDIWLFRQDFDLKDVILQEGETVDAKYATIDEIRELVQNNKFIPCDYIGELYAKVNEL